MREILFRGKTKANHIYDAYWLYGDLVHLVYNEGLVFMFNELQILDEVDPETVGQFTGLTDKHGKKIFEGDIVKLTDKSFGNKWKAVVEFGNPNGNYTWGWQLKPIGKAKNVNTDILCWVEMEETGAFCDVIGNKWDNPELLEVKE